MPSERTLFGIKYYSVKRNIVSHCAQCGKRISTMTPAYIKGSPDGDEILCRERIINLSNRYQFQAHDRVPFPENAPLYVGTIGHTCLLLNDVNYPGRTAIFRRKKQAAYLLVHYCTKCNRYFIEQTEYQKNRQLLSSYRLIHTITEKPIPGFKGWADGVVPTLEEQKQYAPSVVWAYQHPYQGGGCSGK